MHGPSFEGHPRACFENAISCNLGIGFLTEVLVTLQNF